MGQAAARITSAEHQNLRTVKACALKLESAFLAPHSQAGNEIGHDVNPVVSDDALRMELHTLQGHFR